MQIIEKSLEKGEGGKVRLERVRLKRREGEGIGLDEGRKMEEKKKESGKNKEVLTY